MFDSILEGFTTECKIQNDLAPSSYEILAILLKSKISMPRIEKSFEMGVQGYPGEHQDPDLTPKSLKLEIEVDLST